MIKGRSSFSSERCSSSAPTICDRTFAFAFASRSSIRKVRAHVLQGSRCAPLFFPLETSDEDVGCVACPHSSRIFHIFLSFSPPSLSLSLSLSLSWIASRGAILSSSANYDSRGQVANGSRDDQSCSGWIVTDTAKLRKSFSLSLSLSLSLSFSLSLSLRARYKRNSKYFSSRYDTRGTARCIYRVCFT